MHLNSTTAIVVAVGRKEPESVKFVVDSRIAEFEAYCDGQLANIRKQPFETCATWAEQRGWLDSEHYRCIPPECDPADFESERRALYARYGVCRIGGAR